MFGIINSKQDIQFNNCPKLKSDFRFVGVSVQINEESLFLLIKNQYDSKDKENLLKSCDIYQRYEYKKYLDIINKYIDEYK